MNSLMAMAALGLSFGLSMGDTTDVPELHCAQTDRGDRTWIICTEQELDVDEVEAIIELGEAHRGHPKESGGKKGRPL